MKWPKILARPVPLPPLSDVPPGSLPVRLLWMAGIWAASVMSLLLVAWLIRLALT